MQTASKHTVDPNKLIWQTLLSDYPHKHKNRMELDHITEQINRLALRISGELEYQIVVDFILNLISHVVLPNSVLSSLEFDLFKYRYFWWTEHELKRVGIKPPPHAELNEIVNYFKRLS